MHRLDLQLTRHLKLCMDSFMISYHCQLICAFILFLKVGSMINSLNIFTVFFTTNFQNE